MKVNLRLKVFIYLHHLTLQFNHVASLVIVALVERNSQPGGLALVNSYVVGNIFYKDKLALSEGVSNVS